MNELVECPDCNGKGQREFAGFVDGHRNGKRFGEFRHEMQKCYRCKGEGKVPAAMLEWIKQGEAMRRARIARHESLKDAADRFGIDFVRLSHIEHGYEPMPEGGEA
jgi:hypothetical protein